MIDLKINKVLDVKPLIPYLSEYANSLTNSLNAKKDDLYQQNVCEAPVFWSK